MFIIITVSLFAVYSHNFFKNPQFSSNESMSYITYTNETESYFLQTNRTTLAVGINANFIPQVSKYFRVRFY